MKNPCKNCEKRRTACWGDCEEYLAWKAECQTMKDAEHKNTLVTDYQTTQIRRAQARKHKKNKKVVSSNAQK